MFNFMTKSKFYKNAELAIAMITVMAVTYLLHQ